jgi:hypothetical protein
MSGVPTPASDPTPDLAFELTLQARDFYAEWKRCSMVANYISEYASYQFPQRERAENLISTIANEILESVVRLAPDTSDLVFRCEQTASGLLLETEHFIRPEAAAGYQEFLACLRAETSEELFLRLLTTDDERPVPTFNELGLTMLVQDFGVHLSDTLDAATNRICTKAAIAIEEMLA